MSSPCITSVSAQRPKDLVVEVPVASNAEIRRAVQRAVGAGPTVHVVAAGQERPAQSGSGDANASTYGPPEQGKPARDCYSRIRTVPVGTVS